MSSRYGLLLIGSDFSSRQDELFRALGFCNAQRIGSAESVIPGKADDFQVLVAFHNGWTVLGGQFDFNVLPNVSCEDLPAEIAAAPRLTYFAVEGTSGGLLFRRV
jgi:hypothetical protein